MTTACGPTKPAPTRILLVALAGPALAQKTYDDGMRAYEAGAYKNAERIWRPLAEGGDPVAQYSLGKLFETGGGEVAKDYVEASKWYRQSAVQGIPAAQNNLGLMYAQGRGVPRNTTRAAEFWLQAAQQDHPIAQFNLALAYFRGEGLPQDKVEAGPWFRRAAGLGLADAQFALGQVTRLGLIAPKDEAGALKWYEMAAAQGHEKAREQAELLRARGVRPAASPLPASTREASAAPTKPIIRSEPEAARAAMTPAAPPPAPTLAEDADTASAPQPPRDSTPQMAAVRDGTEDDSNASMASDAATVGEGAYRIWLGSLSSEAEAASLLNAARAAHPEIFAGARGGVDPVDLGRAGTSYRVVADGLPSREVARDLCRRLRAADRDAFCKLLAN